MVVGSAGEIVGEGEDGVDAAKKHRVKSVHEAPRPAADTF